MGRLQRPKEEKKKKKRAEPYKKKSHYCNAGCEIMAHMDSLKSWSITTQMVWPTIHSQRLMIMFSHNHKITSLCIWRVPLCDTNDSQGLTFLTSHLKGTCLLPLLFFPSFHLELLCFELEVSERGRRMEKNRGKKKPNLKKRERRVTPIRLNV